MMVMNMKLKQRCSCLRIASNACNGEYTKPRGITKRFCCTRDCLTNTWTLLEYAEEKKKHHSCHIGATCPVAQLLKKCLHRCRIWSSIFQLVKGTAVVLNADGQKTATRGCCHGVYSEKSHVFDSTKWLTSLMSSALVVVLLFFFVFWVGKKWKQMEILSQQMKMTYRHSIFLWSQRPWAPLQVTVKLSFHTTLGEDKSQIV